MERDSYLFLYSLGRLPAALSVPWVSKSVYFGEGTEEDADHAWDAISIDNGSIALEFAYVQEMGLPPAVNLKSFSGTICGHPASCPCSWMPQT